MKLQQVKEYNQRCLGANNNRKALIKGFGEGEGIEGSDPLYCFSEGWVVSGYKGDDSHKYFESYELAVEFINNN